MRVVSEDAHDLNMSGDGWKFITEEEEKNDYYDESFFEEDLKALLEEFNNEVKNIDKLYESTN